MKKVAYIITGSAGRELVGGCLLNTVAAGINGREVTALHFAEDGVLFLLKGTDTGDKIARAIKEQGVKAVIVLVRSGGSPGSMGQDTTPAVAASSGGAHMARVEPSMQTAPIGAADIFSGLSSADLGALQAALAEIDECARILHMARA